MKTQTIEKTEIIIEEKDMQTMIDCLNYCYHRLTKHGKCGLEACVKPSTIDEMRKILKEINK